MANPLKIIQGLLKAENEIGEYITSPGGNPLERWYKDRFIDRCNEFANLPPWARALSGVSGGSIGRICQPVYDEQGFDGPAAVPPFTGGQCVGARYTGTWTAQIVTTDLNGNNQQTQNLSGNFGQCNFPPYTTGPLGGFQILGTPPVVNGAIVRTDGTAAVIVFSTSIPGNRLFVSASGSVGSVAPCPGQPDNCGDPPPELQPGPNPPPNPGPQPGPEPTDDPDGGPIPFIPIPPYEDPDFGPQPFTEPPEPGGGGEPPTAGGGDGLPGTDDAIGGEAGQVAGGGEGDDIDFGPPPEGRVWVGVQVECTVDSRLGNIPGTGPANTVYPTTIGNLSLRYQGGRGESRQVRSKFSEVYRPVTTLVVIGAFVQCQPGVTASVRPVSAIICPENTCGDPEDG